jgi:hypothetical protein
MREPLLARTRIGIVESGRFVARSVAIESRLFEVAGALAPIAPAPGATLLLARHCRAHARHADTWDALVPVLHGVTLDPDDRDPADAELWGSLDLAADRGREPNARIALLYGTILPVVIARYEAFRHLGALVADAPVSAALERVMAEQRHEVATGARLMQGRV